MNWLEIIGTAIGLIYLYLEYRASAWLWVASILMPAVYLKVYYDAGLYADFAINIYYIIASVYGLFCWLRRHGDSGNVAEITHTPKRLYLPLAGVCGVLLVIIGVVLSRFTDSTVPWADAFTTALSIVALWMLSRKYLEQWLVWIVVDIGCTILYAYKALPFTSGLYLLYTLIAIAGYRKWKNTTNESSKLYK